MSNSFQNPILDGYADTDILCSGGLYYLFATSYPLGCRGYEVYSSPDLVHWENRGVCLSRAWGMEQKFWAPDVKEKDGKIYMLVTVSEHLGLALADSPLGPFSPQNGFLLDKTIDGHIFFDGEEMYLYYVSWRKDHRYGLYGVKMLPDRRNPDFSTETLLITAEEPYECGMSPVAEAPYMLKKDGKYFLTYSGSHYRDPGYCVCYAVSDSPLGPFVKYAGNPILVGDGVTVSGTGHHCITCSPDGKRMILCYHTHYAPGTVDPRRLSLTELRFEEKNGETVLVCGKADVGISHPLPLSGL